MMRYRIYNLTPVKFHQYDCNDNNEHHVTENTLYEIGNHHRNLPAHKGKE